MGGGHRTEVRGAARGRGTPSSVAADVSVRAPALLGGGPGPSSGGGRPSPARRASRPAGRCDGLRACALGHGSELAGRSPRVRPNRGARGAACGAGDGGADRGRRVWWWCGVRCVPDPRPAGAGGGVGRVASGAGCAVVAGDGGRAGGARRAGGGGLQPRCGGGVVAAPRRGSGGGGLGCGRGRPRSGCRGVEGGTGAAVGGVAVRGDCGGGHRVRPAVPGGGVGVVG